MSYASSHSKIPNQHHARRQVSRNKISTQAPHTDERTLNGGLGGTETKTDILVPSPALANLLALGLGLRVKEDVRLLLERTFRLDGQLGRHGCEVSVDRGSGVELGG